MRALFFSFVSFISSSVVFYRESYIKGEIYFNRFIFLVLLFVLRIFFLVFRLNFVRILLGWDGLGLISYLLVIFYQNEKSNAAGIITVLRNRIGDAALLLGVGLLLDIGRWNFMFFREEGQHKRGLLIGLVIVMAITKRAQMPFSAWLPAAIAAPTPVRALVHSSTLVTAGVYLLIRFNPLLINFYWRRKLLVFIGAATSLIAGLRANFERDLKKIVALSTLSQLGIIIFTLSLGFSNLAFFHLLTHASFKALLFICRGKVIHESNGGQDTRKIGGIVYRTPIIRICLNLSNLALIGFPFIAGFYSKDRLIEDRFIVEKGNLLFLLIIGLRVGLSSVYSIRITYLRLLNSRRQLPLRRRREKIDEISLAKLILVRLALIRGAFLSWFIFPSPRVVILPSNLKLLALTRVLIGIWRGLIIRLLNFSFLWLRRRGGRGVLQMWFLPWLSSTFLNLKRFKTASTFKRLDLGWREFFGGQGIFHLLTLNTLTLFKRQKNTTQVFLLIFIGRVLSLIGV